MCSSWAAYQLSNLQTDVSSAFFPGPCLFGDKQRSGLVDCVPHVWKAESLPQWPWLILTCGPLLQKKKKKAQDKNKKCVHVCNLYKEETLAGKLMCVVVHRLWLLGCVAGFCLAQCDCLLFVWKNTDIWRYNFMHNLICCIQINSIYVDGRCWACYFK